MINQRLKRYLPLVLGHRTVHRFILSLMFLFIIMGLPALSGAQQVCQPDGDVDRNGSVTAADALLAFQQALGLTQLTACQRDIADVTPLPSAPDGNITASDALCIFQKALSLPSCLDTLPSTNQPPVADAGLEQFVFANEIVTLSGLGSSDADGTVVSYHWTQTSGPPVALSGANTPNASFIAPEVAFENLLEELEFQLTVTDDDDASDTAVVLVVAIYDPGTNEPPTADAGFDQMVSENILVTLSGSASDSDGTVTDYFWLQISGVQVLLFDADTFNPSFTAPEVDSEAELVFELNVLDDELGFAMDTVTITVLNAVSNTPPLADAGRDRTVDTETEVTLSGSGSDLDGTIVSYRWTQTSGTPVALSGASTRTASFTAPDVDADEELVFELRVIDDSGAWDMDTVTVTVRATPASALREMVFQNPSPGQPSYVIAGDNAGLQYWMDPSGTVQQSLYESADGTQRVRTFYDTETDAPRTVLNEVSGHWLSIREAGPNRVDFWAYDDSGGYMGGFAVYEKSGQYYRGEIVGVPAHEWNQITGQLNPTGASWTGSFVLTGDTEDGLINIEALPSEYATLTDAFAFTDDRGVIASGPPQVIVAGPFNLQKGLIITGLGLVAQGTLVAFAGASLVAGAPWIVAGAGAFWLASMVPDIADGIRQKFGRDCTTEICGDLVNIGADLVASPEASGPVGYAQDTLDGIKDAFGGLRDRVARGGEKLANVDFGLSPRDQMATVNNSIPASPIGPPTVSGSLSGTTTGPQGGVTQVTGTINTSGNFNVSGPNVTISGSYTSGGVTGGTFQRGTSSGTITPPSTTSIPPDQTQYIGEDCDQYKKNRFCIKASCYGIRGGCFRSGCYSDYCDPSDQACINRERNEYNACVMEEDQKYNACVMEEDQKYNECVMKSEAEYNACVGDQYLTCKEANE